MKLPSPLLDLTERKKEPELMDDPALALHDHLKALRGLERINTWTRTPGVFWKAIEEEVKRSARPLKVLDIATGGGDIPIALWKIGQRRGYPIRIDGCDFSPRAVSYARERARRSGADVHFFELDVFKDKIPSGYDIITSSLFLHHLETAVVIDLLALIREAAQKMAVIYDLERNLLNWVLVYLGTRLLSTSPIVHTDGPLSVQGAFTAGEIRELCQKAGLQDVNVTRRFPARFLLTWRKP